MNNYRITYINEQGEAGSNNIIERNEAAARKAFKASDRHSTITDIELIGTDVPATKQQERDMLAAMRKMVEELGPDSYVAAAFAGVYEIAEQNIDNDAADSPVEARNLAWEQVEKVRQDLEKTKARMKNLEATIDRQRDELENARIWAEETEGRLKNQIISKELYRELWLFMSTEVDKATACMEQAAETMAELADTPQDIAFKRSVESYRASKEHRAACERMVHELEAIEPAGA